jgi:Zn-dependent protease with chaperone function
VFYQTIVWFFAHDVHQKLYPTQFKKKSYIISNISFAVPVLLPWVLLSGISDVIFILPFQTPKRILSTPEGEMIYLVIFLFAVAVTAPAMIQKFWRCRPLEPGALRNRIAGLCKKARLEYSNILYWPVFGGRMITAGVMGLIKKFRYILITDALISFLEPDEIDAVIAHEIGHVKKNHLLFYLFFFLGFMIVLYTSFDLIIYLIIYSEPVFKVLNSSGLDRDTLVSAVFSAIFILIFILYFRFIFGYFMRNFERQADIFVYTLFPSAEPLISTFEKIALTSGQPADKPNWHHFSILERINYLKRCENNKGWIKQHDKKVNISITLYLLGIIIVGSLGYTLNFGKLGETLKIDFLEKAIQRELNKDAANPELLSNYGDILYSQEKFKKAENAYRKSLNIEPDNPVVLNNLAWLYASGESSQLYNPEKALPMAQKAASQRKEPFILDTLAQTHFALGNYQKAIEIEKKALEMEKKEKNRSIYRKQLNKFKQAANKK